MARVAAQPNQDLQTAKRAVLVPTDREIEKTAEIKNAHQLTTSCQKSNSEAAKKGAVDLVNKIYRLFCHLAAAVIGKREIEGN